MLSTNQDGRRATITQVWAVLMVVACLRNVVLAQSCTSDANCQPNEFCNLGDGSCNLCLDCQLYNRNSTDAECPKNVLRDCGDCLQGFVQHIEDHIPRDVNIRNEICQPIDSVETQTTDQSVTSTSKTGITTTTTTAAAAAAAAATTSTPRVQKTDQTVKGVHAHPSDAKSTTKIVTQTVPDLFGSHPTNRTGLEYDEFDAKRPWIYVGLAVTFFVLCGTCGVVGFKVFLLPRQLKLKSELRKLRAIERAERNTRKAQEDIASASKEELERLYPDHGQDSTPLILRSYLSKTVRETSH